jgi:hypothetical protein
MKPNSLLDYGNRNSADREKSFQEVSLSIELSQTQIITACLGQTKTSVRVAK